MSITTSQGRDVFTRPVAAVTMLPPAIARAAARVTAPKLALPRLPEGISFFADIFPFIAAALLIGGFLLMAVPRFSHRAAGFLGGSSLAAK